MAYASGDRRNGSTPHASPGPPGGTNAPTSSPSPPSQPRKNTGSRPVLSARASSSSSAAQAASGPLVASVLSGSYAYHNRNASPGPQRSVVSSQHASTQRSSSATLQRTSSSKQRSHSQVAGKPFFAAYGLQYSGNGRNGAAGLGSVTSRPSMNMSPYRHRPSSSAGPPATTGSATMPGAVGRPASSQAPQRSPGENWFGNTKLSVTLPNEAARVVQELGQLLSVFAPPSPSAAPAGPKAPGSFRASKYAGAHGGGGGGGGSSAHKEAWGSGSADGTPGSAANMLLRPTSAASSTNSNASKPLVAPFMADGRHSQGANLSLVRLQQQQAAYGGPSAAAVATGASAAISQYQQQQQQQQQVSAAAGLPASGPQGTVPNYMYTNYMTFQSPNGTNFHVPVSAVGGAANSPQPPRLNLAAVGIGSPANSPKDASGMNGSLSPGGPLGSAAPGTASAGQPYAPPPHPYSQTLYPHAPTGPPPARSWDLGHPGPTSNLAQLQSHHHGGGVTGTVHGYASGGVVVSQAQAPQQVVSPRPSGSNGSGGYHYLPAVDGVQAAGGAIGPPAAYTTTTVAATGTSTQTTTFGGPGPSPFQLSPLPLTSAHAATTPSALPFHNAVAAATVAAMGNHALQVPQALPSTLGPSPHSAPLHFSSLGSTATASTATPSSFAATGGSSVAGAIYSAAASKAVRDSFLTGNASSSNVSNPSPNSSASQVQQMPPGSSVGLCGASGTQSYSPMQSPPPQPSAPLASVRNSSVANAPLPTGLPPPSPLKVAPPVNSAPGSGRSGYVRSSSSRSSNGCAVDSTTQYYMSVLAAVQDMEREETSSGSGTAPSVLVVSRPAYSVTTGDGSAPPPQAAAISSPPPPSTTTTPTYGGSGSHVTWGASVTQITSTTPSTPTRMSNVSYSDLTSRRVSSAGADISSPFARGVEGYSRMLTEHGTLTCLRPSTVPSNFAADSQTELTTYGELPGPSSGSGMYVGCGSGAATSPSTGATWTPGGTSTAAGLAGSMTSGSAAAAAMATMQPWRRSVDDPLRASGSGAGSSTSGAALQQQQQQTSSVLGGAHGSQQSGQHEHQQQQPSDVSATVNGTSREDGVWSRSRDPTPSRSPRQAASAPFVQQQPPQQQPQAQTTGTVTTTTTTRTTTTATSTQQQLQQQQQQQQQQQHLQLQTNSQQWDSDQRTATRHASSAASSGTNTPLRQSLNQSTLEAPISGGTFRPSAPSTAASQQAPAPSTVSPPPPSSTVTPTSTSTSVPLPADQPLRPKHATNLSPRYSSPWSDASPKPTSTSTGPAHTSTAAATTTASHSPASSTAPPPPSATTTTTAPTAASAPAAPTSSSAATSSAAGSAVSSGSTSSGTVSSSFTTGGSTSGGAGAAGTGSSPHLGSSLRRAGSIVARFNPATVLGSEPDATFGNLLPGYSVGKVIGEGGFCQVRLAVHHLSQRKVAVKVIDRAKLTDPNEAKRMQREIRVMKHLSHQCVIKLFEVVESPRHLFLVMEHAPAGSLLDYVRARKRLPEADACMFFQQIVASLEYCHSREVVHRDIKLENILLDADQRMKLIDFGLSAFFVPGKRLRVHCGSPSYAAPEIVARKAYEGPPVDVWSLGVVLFAMVAGYLPFHASGGNKQELCNKIIAGQYTAPDWLSASMKDLLARMLTTDPEKRITFPQVWQHSWIRNGPQWHERGINCYEVLSDPSAPGGLRCDEQVVAELEAAGYTRSSLAQHLVAGDANHLTASYFLLCEAKADALRRMRGTSATPRGRTSSSSVNVRGSSGAGSASHGSAAIAAAMAKARTAESPGRSSRPSTAVGGSSGAYSARGHRSAHPGDTHQEVGMSTAGRMAVAV